MSKNNSSHGIGFWGLLGITFIVLKLTEVIDWSWWFVLMPIYGKFILSVIVSVVSNRTEKIDKDEKTVKSKFHQRLEEMQKERSKNKF